MNMQNKIVIYVAYRQIYFRNYATRMCFDLYFTEMKSKFFISFDIFDAVFDFLQNMLGLHSIFSILIIIWNIRDLLFNYVQHIKHIWRGTGCPSCIKIQYWIRYSDWSDRIYHVKYLFIIVYLPRFDTW